MVRYCHTIFAKNPYVIDLQYFELTKFTMPRNLTFYTEALFRACGIKMLIQISKRVTTMTNMIDIKVKNQFSQILDAKALLRSSSENNTGSNHIEHIVVDGEVILPSIELLFESQNSSSIYKVIEA